MTPAYAIVCGSGSSGRAWDHVATELRAVVLPAPDAPESAWADYVYLRDNPCGPHDELWYHGSGCKSWFKVRRDTRTHDIVQSAPIGEALDGERA